MGTKRQISSQIPKAQIRKRFQEMRNALLPEEASERSVRVCRRIESLPLFQEAETIYFYYPIGNETDLLPLARRALKLGKKAAFPKTDGQEMEFFQVASVEEGFQEGRFHVMEPAGGLLLQEQEPLVLTPGIAFGKDGSRMGYGGGYYDRYFARFPRCLKVGACYGIQLAQGLPVGEHDVPMDAVVTEERVLWKEVALCCGLDAIYLRPKGI